ncbi:MAG TPA: hypothetical protein DCY20_01965 [Firmicutes bacterium]|nr:hypothetical protein [Bacillota bacterium]
MIVLKPTVKIDTSYLLDLFCFLDLLFSDEPHQMDVQIEYWEDYVTKESAKNLRKARKCLPKNESFISMLLPLLCSDPEFNVLQASELLGSPKFLISNFKKQMCFKNCMHKPFKQFINGDCEKVIKLVAPMITELERGRFKHYWIHERLPLINNKLKELESYCSNHHLYEEVSKIGIVPPVSDKNIYVLSFYRTTTPNLTLPQLDVVTHPNVCVEAVIQDVVKTLIPDTMKQRVYKKEYKVLKQNKSLQQAYHQVKGEHKNIVSYIEGNIFLATHAYLNEKLDVLPDPYEVLARHEFGHYKFSVLMYHQMKQMDLLSHQTYEEFIKSTLMNMRLDYIDEQFLDIMNNRI